MKSNGLLCALLVLGGLATPPAALADPNDYVRELEIGQGETEVDIFLGSASGAPAGVPAANALGIGLGRGLTSWWKTEVAARFATPKSAQVDSLEWESTFRFAEEGEWPVDIGAILEVERPRDSLRGWGTVLGPAFQVDRGRMQFNANLFLLRTAGGLDAMPTHWGYQLQAKFRARELFEYGLQAFGNAAANDSFGHRLDATHRLGPALFGRIRLAPGRNLKYNAAFLVGNAQGAPDRTLRGQVEFEF
jgi:hypothetical protein